LHLPLPPSTARSGRSGRGYTFNAAGIARFEGRRAHSSAPGPSSPRRFFQSAETLHIERFGVRKEAEAQLGAKVKG